MKLVISIIALLSFATACSADYLGSRRIDEPLTFPAQTHDPSTGSAFDADSLPTYRVYEDETDTPILTGTMAVRDDTNTGGFYTEQITLSAANGFEQGKSYTLRIQAVMGGVTAAQVHNFQIAAAANLTHLGGQTNTITNMDTVYNTDWGVVWNTATQTWNVNVVSPGPNLSSVWWGDFRLEGQLIPLPFSTPGIVTGGTVVLYEEGSATAITDAETYTPNLGGVGSQNLLQVDLNNAAFEPGKTYAAKFSAGTLPNGGSLVGQQIGTFSTERFADEDDVAQAVQNNIDGRLMSVAATTIANTFFGSLTPIENLLDFAIEGYSQDENAITNIADNGIRKSSFVGGVIVSPIHQATAQAGAAGSITLDTGASSTSNLYRYQLIYLLSGPGAGQARVCTGYNGTTKVATVQPEWTAGALPDNTTVFQIIPVK